MIIHSLGQRQDDLLDKDGKEMATRWVVHVTFFDGDNLLTLAFFDDKKTKSDRRYNMFIALAELDGTGIGL